MIILTLKASNASVLNCVRTRALLIYQTDKTYSTLLHSSPLKREIVEGIDFIIFRELGGMVLKKTRMNEENKASDSCEYSEHEITKCTSRFQSSQNRRKKSDLGG
jgi:isocitrate/isopropylmalate dehydrogenase